MKESIIYYSMRIFGFIIRHLPIGIGLGIGKLIGLMFYYFDPKHRAQASANLKIAFAKSKSPEEIKQITKQLFMNYGQNVIELLCLPLMTPERFEQIVKVEGKEHVTEALKKGKGVIFLPMHFGSWELASPACAMMGFPYKVIVKPQTKYSKLDNLLNNYRACGGSVVLARGLGTRDLVRSLKNNEVLGMVVDQGGRDGVLVPFFNRQASMSVGAIRLGLKWGVPLCFSIIIRENGPQHRLIIHKPLELVNTGDVDHDVAENLKMITKLMEGYIRKYPAEYMWFYKTWKYSRESFITVLSDGKAGHYNQSLSLAKTVREALKERGIKGEVNTIKIEFKKKFHSRLFSLLSVFSHPFFHQGRLDFLRWFLTKESFEEIMSIKADFIVSCGSSLAGINHIFSQDHNAKSMVILKPGILNFRKFDLVVLPQHDNPRKQYGETQIVITCAAPNLIDEEYLNEQKGLILKRYTHLQNRSRLKIGVFIGGEAQKVTITTQQINMLIHQIKQVAGELKADLLVTTSRRTPRAIENALIKNLKKDPLCPLLIIANHDHVPEAVGGILGLADINIISGDSISMVSEAASSGKSTIVFYPELKLKLMKKVNKHLYAIEKLHRDGYVMATDVKEISHALYAITKNRIKTKTLDDRQLMLNSVRNCI